jgi:hypothetical protein
MPPGRGTISSTSTSDIWRGNLDNIERREHYVNQRGGTKLTPKQAQRIGHKMYTAHEHVISRHTPNVRLVATHKRPVPPPCEICKTPASA